jgi:hypothetical protein
MYEMVEGQGWLRGPRVSAEDLAGGNYFTVVGAAQFFGRGVEKNIAKILTERLGVPCLNLSFNGAGVNTFTAVPEFIDLINGGMFSIVQTMSGRSIGVPGEPESFLVVDYLDDLYRTNPSQVEREINRFNRIYLDDYAKLASAITVPAAMLFTSIRAPEDWSPAIGAATGKWGKFPQLVGADLHAEVATMFEASFEVLEAPPDRVSYSRFTGEPAPRFGEGPHGRIPDRFDPCELKKGFDYYPGAAAHVQMADAVEEWIRGILAQRFNMIM